MQVDPGYTYPDYEVLLTLTPEDIDEIMAKGSLEDGHIDQIVAAIRYLHLHCRD
jgi:hypothetical protein